MCRGRGFMGSLVLGAEGANGASKSHGNTLQHTAATHCCNTLLQHTATTHCTTLTHLLQQRMSMRSVVLGAAGAMRAFNTLHASRRCVCVCVDVSVCGSVVCVASGSAYVACE